MHTILGAGGAIGSELARSLNRDFSRSVRLVSRRPRKVNTSDERMPLDLTQPEQVSRAVRGSDVVYLTVGLPYGTKLWQELWPPLMRNVMAACREHQAKLVFFDNVYALGGDRVRHMTERTEPGPSSRKGEIRAELERMVQEQVEHGRLTALIARAPDFFGPIKQTSMLMTMVYDRLVKGQHALWFCDAGVPHTFGYAPELARAAARLGNTSSAFDQIWHLPTGREITGEQWVALFAEALSAQPRLRVLPKWEVRLLGGFTPMLREMVEMLYQYDRPYVFDSSKYKKAFTYKPIGNAEAVRETVEALQPVPQTV